MLQISLITFSAVFLDLFCKVWNSSFLPVLDHCMLSPSRLLLVLLPCWMSIRESPVCKKHPDSMAYPSCPEKQAIKWVSMCLQCFDAVGWAAGRHPACEKHGVMGCWRGYLSGARIKCFAYGSADATATPSSLASAKSRRVYPSGTGLPRLSWKKGH